MEKITTGTISIEQTIIRANFQELFNLQDKKIRMKVVEVVMANHFN